MNKPIRTMSVFAMLLFVALLLNATYLHYVHADELNDDPNNRRVGIAAFSRDRGAILVGSAAIAESVPVDDKYRFQREYPTPFKYAHVTGHFSYFSQTGIEKTQNQVLSGQDSRFFVNRLVDLVQNAEPKGGRVQLTLDAAAQEAAFEGLRKLGEGTKGAVVALEPSTGRILAMVSSPTFDPNRLADHELEAASEAYRQLDQADQQPLLNRGTQTALPPGSTFKLVTAAAAIESGRYDADSTVRGGPAFKLPQSRTSIRNHDGGDCGGKEITLTQALMVSCNVAFLSLADELGADALREQAEKFGFNERYLEDLPVQGVSTYPTAPDPPQTAMSGIGQSDVTATPLQMAMVASGIANDGVVYRPYLVDEIRQPPDYGSLGKTDPREFDRAISPGTAQQLREMMVQTVESGTATAAQIPGVAVAGKTGTAQSAADRPPYAWFVSFAPADDPVVAVAVLVESSSYPREEIAGGKLGAPIAKSVMEAVIER
ncbi:MAG: peptidoglycan D,D-transpeptidase FtsI family protein [Nocardioides sp.]